MSHLWFCCICYLHTGAGTKLHFEDIFICIFSTEMFHYERNLIAFCFWGFNWQYVSTGSDNGSVPIKSYPISPKKLRHAAGLWNTSLVLLYWIHPVYKHLIEFLEIRIPINPTNGWSSTLHVYNRFSVECHSGSSLEKIQYWVIMNKILHASLTSDNSHGVKSSLAAEEIMMTSWNENLFRVTGLLCGEFTGHLWIPGTKTTGAEALMFSLICTWINGWVSHCEAGDLRRHRSHYDVIVMFSRKMTLILGRLFLVSAHTTGYCNNRVIKWN